MWTEGKKQDSKPLFYQFLLKETVVTTPYQLPVPNLQGQKLTWNEPKVGLACEWHGCINLFPSKFPVHINRRVAGYS